MRRTARLKESTATDEAPRDSWLRTVLFVLLVFGVILFCSYLMTYSHLLSSASR